MAFTIYDIWDFAQDLKKAGVSDEVIAAHVKYQKSLLEQYNNRQNKINGNDEICSLFSPRNKN